jgi:hypothetical protein
MRIVEWLNGLPTSRPATSSPSPAATSNRRLFAHQW